MEGIIHSDPPELEAVFIPRERLIEMRKHTLFYLFFFIILIFFTQSGSFATTGKHSGNHSKFPKKNLIKVCKKFNHSKKRINHLTQLLRELDRQIDRKQKHFGGDSKKWGRKNNHQQSGHYQGKRKRLQAKLSQAQEKAFQQARTLPKGVSCGGPNVFFVTEGLQLPLPHLPGFEDEIPRPLAIIEDHRGNQAEFVENELVLRTDESADLFSFLARWDGQILGEVTPEMIGDPNFVPQYLIRVNVDEADVNSLESDLEQLVSVRGIVHRISSPAGHRLLAAGAAEAVGGLSIGLNWVGRHAGFEDRLIQEGGEGPSGFTDLPSRAYSRNPYDWNYLRSGSTQDIGVTEAWTALDAAGKLDNQVRVAILDMGYSPDVNGDFPEEWRAISNIPFRDPVGTPNIIPTSSGTVPTWHGTTVLNAAVGTADNGRGAVGTAGPIGTALAVNTLTDFFSTTFALARVRASGVRIANMSFGAEVPASVSWTVIPFNLATVALRASGLLMVSAAGNEGINVDAEDCFLGVICWEEGWNSPCENDGVTCVGGIAQNSLSRSGGSNFGPEEVDIFAPFTVLVGQTPAAAQSNEANRINGTSFASPYLAGVAALIMAANPSLSVSAVENILFTTAQSSPDPSVNRIVKAFDAISQVLNEECPCLNLVAPVEGRIVEEGTRIDLRARIFEGNQPFIGATWTVTADDGGVIEIGEGLEQSWITQGGGEFRLTVRAEFEGGREIQDSVTISVTNVPPQVTIDSPSDNSEFTQSEPIFFRGFGTDPFNPLPGENLSWFLDDSGSPFDSGTEVTLDVPSISIGLHTVTLKGTDGIETAEDSVTFSIAEDSSNLPPVAQILSPASNTLVFESGGVAEIQPELRAIDPDGGEVTIVWQTSVNGGPNTTIGTGPNPTLSLEFLPPGGTTITVHTVTVTVTDDEGESRSDSVTIRVGTIF